MRKPDANDKRSPLYLLDAGRGEFHAGAYIGETGDRVVLKLDSGAVRGFKWSEVEPVQEPPEGTV